MNIKQPESLQRREKIALIVTFKIFTGERFQAPDSAMLPDMTEPCQH